MNAISIQITYQKGRPSAAYIYLQRRQGVKTARSEEVAPEIVVDFDEDDHAIGVEIISPENTGVEEILSVFDKLGLGRPELTDLGPLIAA